MQNQSTRTKYDDKACIQDSKVSRLSTEKSSKRTKDCPPLDCDEKKYNTEKDIHLVKEKHSSKNNSHKSNTHKNDSHKNDTHKNDTHKNNAHQPHNSKSSLSSLFNRIMDFLKSDDALLVFVIILLIQDGIDDDILIGLILYLLLADKFD
ncbi:MAG: hypothetical protein ACM3KR_02990 [Deltaproteobacteria bacterium]